MYILHPWLQVTGKSIDPQNVKNPCELQIVDDGLAVSYNSHNCLYENKDEINETRSKLIFKDYTEWDIDDWWFPIRPESST